MPKFKQPSSLRDAAMEVLAKFLGNNCGKYSNEESVEKLRECVAFIKEEIGPNVPWKLFPEFYYKFLQGFFPHTEDDEDPPMSHQRIVAEIIMDRKIIGLTCTEWCVRSLHATDVRRIQGLIDLDLTSIRVCHLGSFRLQDLTRFSYPEHCTDSDLKIIGRNCSNLKFIDIAESKEITDEGLRALSQCTKLRVVQINECPELTHGCVIDFLSTRDTIYEFAAYPESHFPGFDCFSQSDMSVYPNINTFFIVSPTVSNKELLTVIRKFPNLTELGIHTESLDAAINWSMLRFLKKLKDIYIYARWGFSWNNLKPGLKYVGDMLNNFCTICDTCGVSAFATQVDLDFLYKFCPNVEKLSIPCRERFEGEILTVPPFKNLKEFRVYCAPTESRHRPPAFEFTKMSKLEAFEIQRFKLSKKILISMIVDHVKFPNLKFLGFHEISGLSSKFVNGIRSLVKNSNLDLELVLHSRSNSAAP